MHRESRLEDAFALSKQSRFLNQLEADYSTLQVSEVICRGLKARHKDLFTSDASILLYVNGCVELRDRQEKEKQARRRELRTASS